jgi:hypothetical protein
LVVAVVAAVVSLLSFAWTIGWSVWQHRRLTEPRLKVTSGFAVLAGRPSAFSVAAVNVGQVPVTIASVEAEGKDAERRVAFFNFMFQSNGPLPITLAPGQSGEGFLDAQEVRDAVAAMMRSKPPWEVQFNVGDAARNRHKAEWMTLD